MPACPAVIASRMCLCEPGGDASEVSAGRTGLNDLMLGELNRRFQRERMCFGGVEIQYKSRLSSWAKRVWFLANVFAPVLRNTQMHFELF